MAATLTDTGELTTTYASFLIDKTETTADGDLMVYGKASDGTVDADQQIVDPKWMAKAIGEWFASGPNVRVQHNAQRDPAGVGVTWNTDDAGATFVKSLVVEPIAKKLVSKGALRAYSVGIARPTIERDVTGKARGGIITDGTLVEISLVDRPANKSCGIQLVKSASDGTPEFTQKVFGDEAVIAKFTGADVMAKSAGSDDFTVKTEDMSLTFTPNDLAKILKTKIIDQHYEELASKALFDAEAEVYKRDVSTAERRSLASQGHALSDGSYPIANAGDLHNAAHLASTGHGNVEGARALIARRAKELGVANPLSDTDNDKLDGAEDVTPKEAEPVITKDPEAKAAPKPKKGKKGSKPMPPWMQDSDGKGGSDDGDADDKSATAEACKLDHAHSEKCMPSGTPQSASGASDAASMDEMPNPSAYQNSPMPAGRNTPDHKGVGMSPETAALLRFKSIGIDTDMGRLHDLTCPAFDPEDVAKYHPFADFASLIDEDLWMRKALDAACGPIGDAMIATQVWQAVQQLKGADAAELNDYRAEAHKAFRDANPGPTSYPSPGAMTPGQFKRPCITDGHAALSPGYSSPNSSASVASSAPNAHSFNRPPLSSGHQSPSPSHMKSGYGLQDGYPAEQGVPTRIDYLHIEKDKARRALAMLHDHLSHQFPLGCPMIEQDAYRIDGDKPVPSIAGKADDAKPEDVSLKEMDVALSGGDLPAETVTKGIKKKLAKKVLSGKITVDEARAKLGRRAAQKQQADLADMVEKGILSIDEARAKMGLGPWNQPEMQVSMAKGAGFEPAPGASAEDVTKVLTGLSASANGVDPDIIKTAVADALAPLLEKIDKQEKQISEQEARWEAVANERDPKTASFSGLAMNMVNKNARPAGVAKQAEVAERTQQMIQRQLMKTWRTSEDPFEREAARTELDKFEFGV